MDLFSMLGADSEFLRFINLRGLPLAVVYVVLSMVILRVIHGFLDALGERITERRLLIKQTNVLARFFILVVTIALVFNSLFEFSGQEIYGVLGLVLLAVGYATRDVLSSLTAGFILMFDRPFQVGDRISFGGHYGEVVEMGLRTVRLVDLEDNLVSIPNSRFLSETVACANSGALDQMCVFSFYIGCSEDFERAREIVYEAAASSRYVFLAKPITVVIREGPVPDGAERFAIRLTVKAYVFDGRYETAFGTDVTERVKRHFRLSGIRTAGELEWGPPGSAAG